MPQPLHTPFSRLVLLLEFVLIIVLVLVLALVVPGRGTQT
jgi:hypothetical protein